MDRMPSPQLLHLGDGGAVVHVGGPGGQQPGPHVALVGDEGEVHRHVHIARQFVHIPHPLGQIVAGGGVEMGEQGLSVGAEIDLVVLLLAQRALRQSLELDPPVPQGELVHHIVLEVLHELPGTQGVQRGGLELG